MHELSARGVAARSAVVVGRVPVEEADEEHSVDDVGGLGVAEPDGFATFLAASAQPAGEAADGVSVVDDHRFDEEVLAGEKELTAGLRGRDGRGGLELGDLVDGVGAEPVVWARAASPSGGVTKVHDRQDILIARDGGLSNRSYPRRRTRACSRPCCSWFRLP
jgi:hypothetical protein